MCCPIRRAYRSGTCGDTPVSMPLNTRQTDPQKDSSPQLRPTTTPTSIKPRQGCGVACNATISMTISVVPTQANNSGFRVARKNPIQNSGAKMTASGSG